MASDKDMRDHILSLAIRNLKEMGRDNVDRNTIFTNTLHARFFSEFLIANLSRGAQKDRVINGLLNEIGERYRGAHHSN